MTKIPSEEYREYLKSDMWQRLRSQRLNIDNFKCQRCGSAFRLQVHHTRYVPFLGMENVYTDLITLCDNCHAVVEEEKKRQRMAWANEARERKTDSDLIREQRRKAREQHDNLIRQFIKEHEDQDTSNVGIGKKNYCDLETIKKDFYPWMREHGAEEYDDGYISGCSTVQAYFRNRKYEVIMYYMSLGMTASDIYDGTLFTKQMIDKVFRNPEQAKTFLEKEREEISND